MITWVLIGIVRTFPLLLLNWLFPTGIFFKLEPGTRDYGAATCVYRAAVMQQNTNLFHLQLSHRNIIFPFGPTMVWH